MTVRIVTDSTSDLPGDIVQSLGIIVVPLNVHFGTVGLFWACVTVRAHPAVDDLFPVT